MREYSISNLGEFLKIWKNNHKYFEMLGLLASLSKLFSDNDIPYLDYRITENLFCKYYHAHNDARSCTAYDARIHNIGVGIKTFTLNDNNSSLEKIAEFNKLSHTLRNLSHIELATTISHYRNERIILANNTYNVNEKEYHIVGRKHNLLRIFNCSYDEIDIQSIHVEKDDDRSIIYHDNNNQYVFNKSKSVLLKRFEIVSNDYVDIDVNIYDDPLRLLEKLKEQPKAIYGTMHYRKGIDYVMLPLYSSRYGRKEVPKHSGLNQWNANGRQRDANEVYIPIPIELRRKYPDFFPDRDTPFTLYLPDNTMLSAKVCQDGGKALMTNPNSALGEWLLRRIMRKKEGELVTMFDLDRLGFDSVCIERLQSERDTKTKCYRIFFAQTNETFESFVS